MGAWFAPFFNSTPPSYTICGRASIPFWSYFSPIFFGTTMAHGAKNKVLHNPKLGYS
ncbi:hypothetical protein ARMA_2206 [Ardenticatena maritima]|uniref:Uncharacterized protein n=1 Tax=Ardenticatena maritima TaxID=872965 RepID=A0A0M8K859_9CHLR|nr:hypothetical protein ARMA_2206 [Ardenticatena maritima]